MRQASRYRPALEALEGRDLPSMTPLVSPPLPPSAVIHTPGRHALALTGQLSGTYAVRPGAAGLGVRQPLSGAGFLQPLGNVQVGGRLRWPGSVLGGPVTGTLTLAAPGGTLTLRLAQAGPGGGPLLSLSYRVVHGSGAYQGAAGAGVAVLTENTGGLRPGARAPLAFTLAF